jgi:hypothetical protein
MAGNIVASLTTDLKGDARKLAEGAAVPPEIERRTIGRIGLLVCEFSEMFWPEDKLRELAGEVAAGMIERHAEQCEANMRRIGLLAPQGSADAARPARVADRVWAMADKYFTHIWWGFVMLCLVFGVQRVVDAILHAARAVGG